ncbi:MAG: [protein-PII] uridylyltransferase [Verrucomicrobia bacterium]|nr:[protein-PII] uridylyltransferase [Verrucomicrobiota bacterium]
MPEDFDKLLKDTTERFRPSERDKRGRRLALYGHFFKQEEDRLLKLHRAGGGGREVARLRSAMMDAVLRRMFERGLAHYEEEHPGAKRPPMALVALGGYGRGELNPFSDVDIMGLHAAGRRTQRGNPFLQAVYDGVVLLLYDSGLKVGYCARTVKECVEQANKDLESKTALIEARLLSGDAALFGEFQQTVQRQCVQPGVDDYIEARMRDQAERHRKFGDTVFLQEPNIKSGCGGLRDFQNLLWMSLFKHGVQTLPELEERKFLTPVERQALEAAYDFLLRVRTELHYVTDRPVDVLTLALQAPVADGMGYADADLLRRIERFMRDYYRHARSIFQLTNALALRMSLKPPGYFERLGIHVPMLRLGRKTERLDGFVVRGDMIEPESPEIFRDDPLRLMRVFRLAQQRQAVFAPELQTMIREQLGLVNDAFRANDRARETFLAILAETGNVGRIARMMHEVGFLGQYLPEFAPLDALVQHEFFHRYTADEHTLLTLERLDAVAGATGGPELQYQRLLRECTRPELLYLALLLHDCGKAANAPAHTEVSIELTHRVADRLALDEPGRETLVFLVRHHLDFHDVSQRRDLDDADAIVDFAKVVENRARLDMLLVFTYADMTGTSADVWNEWRNSLLWELYLKTRGELVAGAESQALQEQRLQELQDDVRARSGVPADEVDAHFREMQRRYFLTFTPDEMLQHLDIIHAFMEQVTGSPGNQLRPVVRWADKPDRGYTQVVVCTWDREGLFSKICGSFSYAAVNILSANAYSRYDGVVLDIFNVADVEGRVVDDPEQRDTFEKTLNDVFNRGENLDRLLARHRPGRRAGRVPQGVVPTQVTVDLHASRTRTVVEVQAEDRLGLLYTIAQALARNGLDINLARISTEKGAAFDTFYVVDLNGDKATDAGWLEHVRIELARAIEDLRRRPIEA